MSNHYRKLLALGITVVLLALPDMSRADPYITLSLTGRQSGTSDPFSNTLTVVPGESIDYQLQATLAPVGTSNTNAATIDSYSASPVNGLQSTRFSFSEATTQQVQVNFAAAPTLESDWSQGTGETGGTPTDRGNGDHDIVGGLAIAALGQYLTVPTTNTPATAVLLTGSLTVTTIGSGASSTVQLGFLGTNVSNLGAIRFNGTDPSGTGSTTVVPFLFQQSGSDPFYGLDNLILTGNNATLSFTSPTADFGRVMLGQTPTVNLTLNNSGLTAGDYSGNNSNDGIAGPTSGTAAVGSNTVAVGLANTANGSATTGVKSFTYSITNVSNAGDTGGTKSVAIGATVVDNRPISVDAVAAGRIMLGTTVNTNVNGGSGPDTSFTMPSVAAGVSNSLAGGVTLNSGPGGVLNAANTTRQVSVTFNTPGPVSGSQDLTTLPNPVLQAEGLAGESLNGGNPVTLNYSADAVLAPRLVTVSGAGNSAAQPLAFGGGNILANLITGVPLSGSANLTTSGADNATTRVNVATTTAADANGIAGTGGTTTLFTDGTVPNSSNTGTRNLGGSFTGVGVVNGSVSFNVTTAEAPTVNDTTSYAPVTVFYSATVGQATADNTNAHYLPTGSYSFGGNVLTSTVPSGGSYAGLASMVVGVTNPALNITNGGAGPAVGSTAEILAGTNSGVGGDAQTGSKTVAMTWRTRVIEETTKKEGGNPMSPPLPSGVTQGLVSDVVELTGLELGGTNPATETDPFVLQMNYNPNLLPKGAVSELGLAKNGLLYLVALDPNGNKWENSIDANFGNNASLAQKNFQGSYADFLAMVGNDTNLTDYMGAWGVDVSDHTVWAVLDHNSQFAVVPEPATIVLFALGGLGLFAFRRRARRKKA